MEEEKSKIEEKNSIYKLYQFPKLKNPSFLVQVLIVIIISSLCGFLASIATNTFLNKDFYAPLEKNFFRNQEENIYSGIADQEKAVIDVVDKTSDSVVSIIITKDLPIFEREYINPFRGFEDFFGNPFFDFMIPRYRQKGTEKVEVGGGTGFIISEDGMILTNAHVVSDNNADYTVLTNNGNKYQAKVLGRDEFRDLAIIKISSKEKFKPLKLGDSDSLKIGQTVIAIGNALGEFRNTVSVGVISGLGRTVTAQGGNTIVTQEDIIQTDAAINRGNSGGPLLNLKGEVIGVNFAIAESAQNIGFAIPINKAKKTIEQIEKLGKVTYPFIGIRYQILDNGVLVSKGENDKDAVLPGSPAQKAGIKEGDIILEINGEKITRKKPLSVIIMKYNPGDKVTLKVKRGENEFTVDLILAERPDNNQ
jgi:S1-C subfamily serine protease